MAYIDFIITHYNEPFSVGKNLFNSIAMQKCFNPETVRFILIQDGEENALPWNKLLDDFPYQINVHTIKEHVGIAQARNYGISIAESDWIMFMDFDDMIADVASLAMLIRQFPVSDKIDVIWSDYNREGKDYGRSKNTTFNRQDTLDYRMIGKLYRREYILQQDIRFAPEFPEHCDYIFNTMAISQTPAFKVMHFYTEFYPFFKSYNEHGTFSTLESLDRKVQSNFDKSVYLAYEFGKRGNVQKEREWLLHAITDIYFSIRDASLEPDERKGVTDDVVKFWNESKDEILQMSPEDIEVVLDYAQSEAMSIIQEYYNYYEKEYYLQNDMISFEEFLNFIDGQPIPVDQTEEKENDSVSETKDDRPDKDKRVVVYCGTKETYVSMIASVKSLLATTPVDKVYFLIEDDTFPYEIPDIIECRNVSETGLFDKHGPNYENCWTYMCMMRTAYPLMFPEYDKVLSLDIDVVITENVSDLWDINLDGYYFAGVAEQARVKENANDMYANFGVIMMNLKKLRDDGMGDRLIESINTDHYCCPEQDAFNTLCKGHIYQLPNDYNVTVYSHITGEAERDRILHYAGIKYWKHFGPVKKFYNMTWEEIMKRQGDLHG